MHIEQAMRYVLDVICHTIGCGSVEFCLRGVKICVSRAPHPVPLVVSVRIDFMHFRLAMIRKDPLTWI